MDIIFYLAASIALLSTVLTITRVNAVHALLYLVVSLLAVAVIFFTLGAPFIAALEVIVYAGAIMVLFVFVIMMLNMEKPAVEERLRFHPRILILPVILAVALLTEVIYAVRETTSGTLMVIAPTQVSRTLFGPYLLGVELTSMLLLSGLVTAFHLGRRQKRFTKGGPS